MQAFRAGSSLSIASAPPRESARLPRRAGAIEGENSEVRQILRRRLIAVDLRVAVLAVEAACRRVEIHRCTFDGIKRVEVLRAQIDEVRAEDRVAQRVLPLELHPRQWLHVVIGDAAQEISRRGWSQ